MLKKKAVTLLKTLYHATKTEKFKKKFPNKEENNN
jgi:hypothetical protein